MKTIEQLQAEQAKEIEALKAKHRIGKMFMDAGLPVPEYIGGKLYGAINVSYRKIGALSAAINLMARFPVLVPFAVLRKGFTSIMPESSLAGMPDGNQYKRDVARNAADYAVMVRVGHIVDSPAPTSAKLEFFARIEGTLFNVSIEFGQGYIGACPQLAPEYVVVRGYAHRVESASFKPNSMLYAVGDGFLSYGSGDMGPIKKSDDSRYLFVSDNGGEESAPAECATHAIAQLRNLAAQMGE